MHQKKFFNIIVPILFILALGGVGAYYFILEKPLNPPPNSTPPPMAEAITVTGETTCLTKKSSGPTTLECAIGLKALDGTQYGLKNVVAHDPEYKFSEVGLRVEVSGIFTPEPVLPPGGGAYDVVGTIDVTSIREVKETSGNGCVVSGCNGEICAEEELASICVVLPEHACYRNARCEKQEDGICAWTMTEGLRSCLSQKERILP